MLSFVAQSIIGRDCGHRSNPNPEVFDNGGFVFPCWLIVTNSSASSVGLSSALSTAGFKRLLAIGKNGIVSVDQRETTIVLPKTVIGRYVRLQRLDSLYLSVAEVEVYSDRASAPLVDPVVLLCTISHDD